MAMSIRSSRGALQHLRTLARQYAVSAQEATNIDSTLVEAYQANPFNIDKIDMSELRFEPEENTKGVVQPQLYVGDKKGLEILTPFMVTGYTYFSKIGNFGVDKNFGSGKFSINSLKDAEYELMLTNRPLSIQEGENEQANAFFELLSAFRNKLIAHVGENLSSYDVLNKKHSYLADSTDEVRSKVLSGCTSQLMRPITFKDSESTYQALSLREKVYLKALPDVEIKAFCEEDHDMAQDGYLRKYLPVYDASGDKLPVETFKIGFGDVVSSVLRVQPYIYNVGGNAGIKIALRLRSVTVGRQRVAKEAKQTDNLGTDGSPFGSLL